MELVNRGESAEKKGKEMMLEVEFELNVCGVMEEIADQGTLMLLPFCPDEQPLRDGLSHMSEMAVLKRRRMSQRKLRLATVFCVLPRHPLTGVLH